MTTLSQDSTVADVVNTLTSEDVSGIEELSDAEDLAEFDQLSEFDDVEKDAWDAEDTWAPAFCQAVMSGEMFEVAVKETVEEAIGENVENKVRADCVRLTIYRYRTLLNCQFQSLRPAS